MKHMFTTLTPAMMLGLLAACSNPEATGRYLIDPPTPAIRVANQLGPTVEMRAVSLPEYAAGQEISWQTEDGAVRSNPDNLWADNPERAFTLTLARAISDVTGAIVIAEPWPLGEPAQRRLGVRVEKALAQADGIYRLSGRYFVTNESSGGTNYVRSFDISVPFADDQPQAIAVAQSTALSMLAQQIATLEGPGTNVVTRPPRDAFSLDSMF